MTVPASSSLPPALSAVVPHIYCVHVHRDCCHSAWARRTAHQHIHPHSRPHDPILYPSAGPPNQNYLIVRPHLPCICISRLILPRPALPCASPSITSHTFHTTCCSHLVTWAQTQCPQWSANTPRTGTSSATTGPRSPPWTGPSPCMSSTRAPHDAARRPHATDLSLGGIVPTQIEPLHRCP